MLIRQATTISCLVLACLAAASVRGNDVELDEAESLVADVLTVVEAPEDTASITIEKKDLEEKDVDCHGSDEVAEPAKSTAASTKRSADVVLINPVKESKSAGLEKATDIAPVVSPPAVAKPTISPPASLPTAIIKPAPEKVTPAPSISANNGPAPIDPADTVAPSASSESSPPLSEKLTPELERLKYKVRRALTIYYPKRLNTRDHNSWEVMHAIIGYGVHSELLRSGPQGKPINSVSWLCYNGACKGERMLFMDQGRVAARRGVGVQGHHGQFLAILAQSRVLADYPLLVDNKQYTIQDLIETEQLGCQSGIELTFKLIGLAHYLKDDEPWNNYGGESWTIDRLVEEEIKAPVRGAACGGTHRLMGLSFAVKRRELRGQPIDGQFARAQKYLSDYHKYTFGLQNSDGSFSTDWFTGRGSRNDQERRLQTTGHILEWLVYSLPREQLDDPRVKRAVDYLASMLMMGKKDGKEKEDQDWEIGHLGHACHALAIYDQRRFRTPSPPASTSPPSSSPAGPLASSSGAPLPPSLKPQNR